MSWSRAVALAVAWLCAASASAQIAVDTTACPAGACPSVQGTAVSTLTIPAFATAGSDRFLFVGAGNSSGTGVATTSVVRGGGVAYKGSSALSTGQGAVTCAMPTSGAAPAANDILILVVCGEGDANGSGDISLSTANGFASVLAEQSGDDNDATEENPENNCEVFWKRAVGSDTAPVAADSGDNTTCRIHNFSGAKTSGDPWNVTAGGNDSNANDTSAVIPGATTTVANTLVVLIQGTSNNATSTANCGAATNTDLTSITERADGSNTIGLGSGHCVITGFKASAGSYANTTLTMSVTTYKAAFSIALEPAVQPEAFTELWDVGTVFRSSGHYYVAPATTSASILVTYAGTTDELAAGVVALTGVHQTTPIGTHGTATGTSSPATVTVTAADDEWLVDHVHAWDATIAVWADQTSRWEQESIAAAVSGGSSTQPGTANDVMSWTGTLSGWAIGAVPVKSSGGVDQFIWPCDGWITATNLYVYGQPNGVGTDAGIADIATPYWTQVVAARGGTVSEVGKVASWTFDSAAWIVRIDHESNYSTMYGHMIEKPLVQVGQTVVAGQPLGYNGRSGTVGGHVHFGVFLNGTGVTPSGFTFGDWVTQGKFVPGSFGSLSTISEVPGNWLVKTVVPQDAYATADAGGTVTCTLPRDTIYTRSDSSVGFWKVAACSTDVWIPYSSTHALPRGEAGLFGDTAPTIGEAPIGGFAIQTYSNGIIASARTNQATAVQPVGYPVVGRRIPVDSLVTVHEKYPGGFTVITDPTLPADPANPVGPFFGWVDTFRLTPTDSFTAVSVALANVRNAPSTSGTLVYQFDRAKPNPNYYEHFEVTAIVNGWYQIVPLSRSYDPPQRMRMDPPVLGPAWVEGWRSLRR